MNRPNRHQLNGMSYSEFKTLLKRRGYKVPRRWAVTGFVSQYQGHLYRFRWWNEDGNGFVVDISCSLCEFDRWANSTDLTVPFDEWMNND